MKKLIIILSIILIFGCKKKEVPAPTVPAPTTSTYKITYNINHYSDDIFVDMNGKKDSIINSHNTSVRSFSSTAPVGQPFKITAIVKKHGTQTLDSSKFQIFKDGDFIAPLHVTDGTFTYQFN